VSSLVECAHYVQGGWAIDSEILTVYEIAYYAFLFFCFFLSLYLLRRILKKINFSSFKKKILDIKFKTRKLNKKTLNLLLFISFIFQNFFIFDYVRTKASRIISFVDEYIALASNVSFFNNLDFNAGNFIGGSYSIFLTSGPISAVGSVLGWNLSSNFYISRILNYYWVFALQIMFCFLLSRYYKNNINFLLFTSPLLIFLIPWWQGALYSLGEVASTIIFTNAVFLINKNRRTALFLFGLSIFFGKILTALLFLGFYIPILFREKNIHKVIKDSFYFLISGILWMILVGVFYKEGSVFDYINNQKDLILNHQSSGARVSGIFNFENMSNQILISEVSSWNIYEVLRVGLIPIFLVAIVFYYKDQINETFGYISYSIIFSILLPYLWFWILSPTKWMRYSQHFTVFVLVTLLYFINFENSDSKIKILSTLFMFLFFLDNEKNLIFIGAIFFFVIIFFSEIQYSKIYLKILLVLFLTIDIATPYFEKNSFASLDGIILECKEDLFSELCREKYLD
tara:strand:- start:1495 stop:3036 length:1542 start_codon:yes stop_codon:yes gene_type:complete